MREQGYWRYGVLLFETLWLSGCQQAPVERWVDVPCQPHGFYIAFAGQTLVDVAKVCHVDTALLIQHNAWLTTRQPFAQNTLVWLKPDPTKTAQQQDEPLLSVQPMSVTHRPSSFREEKLTPLNLPPRATLTKPSDLRSIAH